MAIIFFFNMSFLLNSCDVYGWHSTSKLEMSLGPWGQSFKSQRSYFIYFIWKLQCTVFTSKRTKDNNNNSQCGSRFRGVWGDPAVGNHTSIGITTYREVDSLRPTKTVLHR